MSADAKTTVRRTGPVLQIVPAFKTWQGPIGNFVMHIAGFAKPIGGLSIKTVKHFLTRNTGRVSAPGATLLHVEHVNRNMLGAEPSYPFEILLPNLEPLVHESS